MSARQHLKSTIDNVKSIWEFYNILPIDVSWSTAAIVVSARKRLSLSRATTYRYIKMLENKGLVIVIGRGTRKLSNNEKVIQTWKKVALPSFSKEIGDRKTFVKTRY